MTIDQKLRALISLAEKRGYITFDEINETFPDASVEELDQVYIGLRISGIEVMDTNETRH